MKAINFVCFMVLLIVGEALALAIGQSNEVAGALFGVLAFLFAAFVASAIRIANQWERILILRLGKFSSMKGPGLFIVIPVLDRAIFVDIRTLTLDIPSQQVITKDNVPVSINGVVYFKVVVPEDAIMKVQNYEYAMSQFAQATLRDVIGEMTLDQLLSEREKICSDIEKAVEQESKNWGLSVSNIKIQDIDMPEELKKMMSRQASAEREKRATITKAEGDRDAALNLAAAATTMATAPGAMQLRTLQTIDGLGPTASNTVVIGIPMEIMEAMKALGKPREAA
ncbi:MAG: SPFH domain-containing protein [Planctomycetes bacterium]|nr:SPFH domain-containing protein [Planctomycetota bacterium]